MNDKQIHILHIEDDKVDKMVMEKLLKTVTTVATIHHAQDGQEALDKLRGTNKHEKLSPFPQIILSDINMPRMSGMEFLKALRADAELKHLSVFLFTTSKDDHDLYEAYQYNVTGYIVKPLNIIQVEALCKSIGMFWNLCEY